MKKMILVMAFAVIGLGVMANENSKVMRISEPVKQEVLRESKKSPNKQIRKENQGPLAKLTAEQREEFKKDKKQFIKESQLKKLELQEREIEVKKLLLDDNINWTKVEKAIKNKNDKRTEMEVHLLKHKYQMKDKYGIEENFNRKHNKPNRNKKNIPNRDINNKKWNKENPKIK
ncbi:MAG: hypothetical protein GX287_01085 [Fusobacteria bacterium]|nr:hypothetical protein [Fusobacteriota bacterium]